MFLDTMKSDELEHGHATTDGVWEAFGKEGCDGSQNEPKHDDDNEMEERGDLAVRSGDTEKQRKEC